MTANLDDAPPLLQRLLVVLDMLKKVARKHGIEVLCAAKR
jgi:hypothetical protein